MININHYVPCASKYSYVVYEWFQVNLVFLWSFLPYQMEGNYDLKLICVKGSAYRWGFISLVTSTLIKKEKCLQLCHYLQLDTVRIQSTTIPYVLARYYRVILVTGNSSTWFWHNSILLILRFLYVGTQYSIVIIKYTIFYLQY